MLDLVLPNYENMEKVRLSLDDMRSQKSNFDIYSFEKIIEAFDNDIEQYLKSQNDKRNKHNIVEGFVASTTFLLFDDDSFVGVFDLRHELNDSLRQRGGHIAYHILPSQRQKGYAKAGLRLVLEYAKQNFALEKVLLTCNDNNKISYKVMKSVMLEYGGFEIANVVGDSGVEQRMWINTSPKTNKIRNIAIAIIKKENKLLAIRGYDSQKKQEFYRLIGGGIEFGETSEQTVLREIKEEIGLEATIKKNLGYLENIFTYNGKSGHEIITLFRVELSAKDMQQEKFAMIEEAFSGMYAEFVEINGKNIIYPLGAIEKA